MKRGWWAVAACVVVVAVVLLAQPWPRGERTSQQPEADPAASAWTASPDDAGELRRAEPVAGDPEPRPVRVAIDSDDLRQEWRGVGGALTDASVELLSGTPHEEWAELLGPVSWVRLPLTATDFSTEQWSWGWDGTSASPHPRAEAAVEVVRTMLEDRPDLRVVATPWSAPSAMKTTGTLRGGALRDDALDDYAAMLVSQVEELQARGVPVAALTLGNEPGYSADYPSMTMTADQQALLALQVQPELPDDVELWAVDHNWADRSTYDAVLTGAPFGTFSAAAFHCYAGSPDQMTPLPVPAVVTECTGTSGSWSETFGWDLRHLVADSIAAGSTGLLMWNLALDAEGGPRDPESADACSVCRGLVTVEDATVSPEPELTVLTLLDQAAPPGSRVVGSRVRGGQLTQVAFETPEGGYGVLLRNDGDTEASVTVEVDDRAGPTYAVGPGELLAVRT